MRIPRLVNTVLDWWSRNVGRPAVSNPGLTISVVAMVASFAARPVLPSLVWPLVVFSAGCLLGWLCHSPAIWQLQEALHAARQEAQRLRDDNRVLMRERRPENAVETAHLAKIGDGS